jgi:outer membrane protein OmpA-like peptidoglycan-associated protein
MNQHRTLSMTLVALATLLALGACSTVPPNNAMLNEARAEHRTAQDNPQVRDLAGKELMQAGEALRKADEASERRDSVAEVDHLAYLARQRVAIAQQSARQRAAEGAVTNADAARDQVLLAGRTMEADKAKNQAEVATLQSQESQRQAMQAQARAGDLEAQLKALNARKTDRGMVVTFGDVFFDTDQSQLKSGGLREVDKLGGFLKNFPQRKAMVEGFTDSVGSADHNQALSGRRADAVRQALLERGVDSSRVSSRGYGETNPVAGNDTASGRQLNRRVEIVLSDDQGVIVAR